MNLFRLLLLFTIIPVVELALLIELGSRIGTALTVLLVLVTGALGATMARSQGLAVLHHVRTELRDGQVPAEGLVDGLLTFVGGILLLTPGLLTDLTGVALILPSSRRRVKLWLKRTLQRWIESGTIRLYFR